MQIFLKLYFLISSLLISFLVFVQFHSCSFSNKTEKYSAFEPEAEFVGGNKCESCHREIYSDFLQTGMGKAFYTTEMQPFIEKFDTEPVYDGSMFYYLPFRKMDKLYIKEFMLGNTRLDTTYIRIEKMDYVVGSGNQTRSYIINRNGYLFEAPITWYVEKSKWDMSPGYENGNNSRFTRPIGKECMGCHNAHFEFTEDTPNHYTQIPFGIDCESCHGPGSEHVSKMEDDDIVDVTKKIDYSIINSGKLSIDRQFDVCQRCHLQGTRLSISQSERDFIPSEKLNDFISTYFARAENDNEFGISSHAERLKRSKCFINSKKLTCTTCHDPHRSIHKTGRNSYQKICQNCHSNSNQLKCSNFHSTQKCIDCHMPKGGTSDIPHVKFTDHFIRIKNSNNDLIQLDLSTNGKNNKSKSINYIKLLCISSNSPTDEELGLAYLQYYEQSSNLPVHLEMARDKLSNSSKYYELAKIYFFLNDILKAEENINKALALSEKHLKVKFLKAEILEIKGKYEEAFELFFEVYRKNPKVVEAGTRAAVALLNARQGNFDALKKAEEILNSVIKTQPFNISALNNQGFIKLNQKDYRDAELFFQEALKYDPVNEITLNNLILLYELTGKKELTEKYKAVKLFNNKNKSK